MKGPGRGAGWKREGMALGMEGSAGGSGWSRAAEGRGAEGKGKSWVKGRGLSDGKGVRGSEGRLWKGKSVGGVVGEEKRGAGIGPLGGCGEKGDDR